MNINGLKLILISRPPLRLRRERMTQEEYKQKLADLRREYDEKVEHLNDLYAIDNNPYKAGDIFEDHCGKIRIDKIDTGISHERLPCCVFYGLELKKDGTPKKNGNSRMAWQCNDIKL